MVHIRPIRDEAGCEAALAEVEGYFDHQPVEGAPEADHFAVLLDLIAAYEARRWPIGNADPIEVLLHTMQLTGRSQSDLAEVIGSRPSASEIIRRKRRLNEDQIYMIARAWNIPADVLITPYELSA